MIAFIFTHKLHCFKFEIFWANNNITFNINLCLIRKEYLNIILFLKVKREKCNCFT